jgi:hypothetical protein
MFFKFPLAFSPENSLPHLEQLLWLLKVLEYVGLFAFVICFVPISRCWDGTLRDTEHVPFLCRLDSPKRARNLTMSTFGRERLSWWNSISFRPLVWEEIETGQNHYIVELFGPGHFIGLGLGLRLKSEIRTRARTRART